MRGKASLFQLGEVPAGITPAYAGKSKVTEKKPSAKEDHPRLCGEKSPGVSRNTCLSGSPPPMRGKALVMPMHTEKDRITPAYAGKSGGANPRNHVSKDHPRLCGEKQIQNFQIISSQGSPPPMRGKDFFVVQPCTAHGITPAYAGKS